jgi:hypothetical protein
MSGLQRNSADVKSGFNYIKTAEKCILVPPFQSLSTWIKTNMCLVGQEDSAVSTNMQQWTALQRTACCFYWTEIICTSVAENNPFMYMQYPFLGTFAKLQIATIRFITSIRTSALKNSVPIGKILMKFISPFSKICRKNSSVIKIWQKKRVLYIKTYVQLW